MGLRLSDEAVRVAVAHRLSPSPHQQQCSCNIVECYKLNDSFDNVECCFDIVAVFGNNVERNFVLSTKSKQIEHVQFFRLCRKDEILQYPFDNVAVCDNKVECCFDKVERCFDNVACCFDNVAVVDGAEGAKPANRTSAHVAKQLVPVDFMVSAAEGVAPPAPASSSDE